MKTARRSKLLIGIALVVGLTFAPVLPASAASQTIAYLRNVPQVQQNSVYVSFLDSVGAEFWFQVTTTWQRQSSTQATIGTLAISATQGQPRGNCVQIDPGYARIGWQGGYKTVCPGQTAYWGIQGTSTVYPGTNNLGQLSMQVPNPGIGGGARWMTVEYQLR